MTGKAIIASARPTRVFARGLGLGLFAAAALATAGPAAAQYTGTVIMTGLNAPRGLEFAPDGSLYVAETGFFVPGGPTTTVRGVTFTYSETGSITRYSGGLQDRIVTGLPSLAAPMSFESSGPADIAFGVDGTAHVLFGLGNNPAVRSTDLAPGGVSLGQIFTFDDTGLTGSFADVAAYEGVNNPAGGMEDSNPFHFVTDGNGFLVTDAGSNTLLRVAADGTVSLVATFPGRFIGPPAPMSDSVPTGIAIGPDGAIYVAELTGFPFTPGAARIYRVPPGGGAPTVHYAGSTMITDIAFDGDGNLYALELDTNGLIQPGGTGALIRVGAGGTRELLFSQGLVSPTGLAIGTDGAFYVSNFSTSAGGGQVLRIQAVPEPATWAMMIGGFGLVGGAMRRRGKQVAVAA